MATPMTWPGTVPHHLREEPKMNSKLEREAMSIRDAAAYLIDVLDDSRRSPFENERCYAPEAWEDAIAKVRAALSTEAQPEVTGAWVMVEDALPPFVEGKDTSDNVLAVYKSWNDKFYVSVFRREIVEWDDDGSFTYTWAKMSAMYHDLQSAECEWDDDYTVIKWMPIPSPDAPLYPPSAIEAAVRERLEEAAALVIRQLGVEHGEILADDIRALMESPHTTAAAPTCTSEEAAELAKTVVGGHVLRLGLAINGKELAAIINADRSKR